MIRSMQHAALTAASIATVALMTSMTHAGTYTYVGAAASDVNVATNWTPNAVPTSRSNTDSDTAEFNTGGTYTLSNGGSNTVAGTTTYTGKGLTLSVTATDALTIDTNAWLFRFANGNAITVAAGAGAFSLGNGTGTVTTQQMGYQGGQTHTFTNNSSNTATIASDIIMTGGGDGSHTMAFAGPGNWAMNALIRNDSDLTRGGLFSVTKSGAGTLTLANNSNVYSGATTITGGTVKATTNNALGFGGQYTLNRTIGSTTVNGATAASTLDLAGATTVNEVINLTGGANGASLINSTANSTVTVGNGVAAVLFSNAGDNISGVSPTNVNVSFSGGGGTGAAAQVRKGSTGGAGISVIWMTSPGSGYTTAPTVSVNVTSPASSVNAVATAVLTSVTLSGTNNNIGGDGNLNIAAVIGEAVAGSGFNKVGNGVTTLSGKSTFTGPAHVKAGKLALAGSLDGATAVLVDSGGYLQLSSATALSDTNSLSLVAPVGGTIILDTNVTVGSLVIDGIARPAGIYSANSAPAGFSADKVYFAGTGSLTVIPEPASGLLALGVVPLLKRRRMCN